MSSPQQQVEEFDYIREEHEIVNLNHEMEDEDEEDEVIEHDELSRINDTTASQARQGKDIQGILWDRLSITREHYRLTRLKQYRNHENVPLSGKLTDKQFKPVEKGGSYYEFFHNTGLVKPTIPHIQLRNLLWATTKHDVYLMSKNAVTHWSSLAGYSSEIVNFAGHVAPTEKHVGSLVEGFAQTRVSTIAIKENFLVACGFNGEIICKRLDREGVSYCGRTTHEVNSIINAVEIYNSLSGVSHFMASNNDCGLREYEMEGFQLLNHFRFPWPVNHTSVSPDRRLIAVVGDHTDGLLVDSHNGKAIATMVGHRDYSFATSWHPDGRTFATGNQDKTCRVWDVRNLSSATMILKSNLGAVRSIRHSSGGRFLALAEAADFVHIYSVDLDYKKQQEIDFFGEISGISLSPDEESLFIGIWDRTYSSLLQYNKRHNYGYLDSYL